MQSTALQCMEPPAHYFVRRILPTQYNARTFIIGLLERGYTFSEIAKRVGVHVATVKSWWRDPTITPHAHTYLQLFDLYCQAQSEEEGNG